MSLVLRLWVRLNRYIGGGGSGPPPPVDNGLLLEDNVSFILLEDGTYLLLEQ